ncbi:MAG: hypothetical protein H6R19_2223 [Proteobacteria bacterium]|nr:hypothetical protein [Pseudomonadota bacterium]
MTAFTSPCWRKLAEPVWPRVSCRRLYLLLHVLVLVCLNLCVQPAAQAAGHGMDFRYHEVVPVDLLYVVNASIEMQPNPRLQEMVESGLAIPFQAEFVLTHPRWYWMDETIVERTMNFRLSYHALTRQYRLAIGSIHRSFTSFDEALRAMLTLRNWAVLDRSRLSDGESYEAALRVRLDTGQLPKPFQVAALGNRDLDLTTSWARWNFVASAMDSR